MLTIKSKSAAAALVGCAIACLIAYPIRADEKEEGTVLRGWGRAIDPDHDCDIALKEGSLEFKIPGKSHDYAADIQIQNSPRVLREIKGDFIAEVKVCGEFKPGETSTIPGRLSYHGAGLLLIKDKDNYFSLHRGCVFIDQRQRHYANFELRKDGGMAFSKYEIEIPDQDTYLRLERRGNWVFNATSPDGIHWTSYEPAELDLPETVQLGLVGVTSSDVPLSIRFRDLNVFRKVELE